ncbi:hypothetical protein [Nocardioides sp. GY 10127]|uniref:hypothetical protein n=1 Tax=Nocardioides sp. GY 10127 TaxID=2569762 RepID=UPI0010A7696E|nr:hypothetical protein [Nocardioides sp. GY 10127]TIC84353.1 hypothetical protein E8D37_06165 [Nocardioides sp. GY 10127]
MRATLDKFASTVGIALVAVLLVAGGLLTWASGFIGDQVYSQLSAQNITMPTEEAYADFPQADQDALAPYAGEALTTGAQARAYADHYIAVHMDEMADGQTYSEISGQYLAMTDKQKASDEGVALGQLRQTLFMGNTLRGLLLYGFAFATIGTVAGYAAVASFVGAGIMLVLVVAGLRHARKAQVEAPAQTPAAAAV